MASGVRERLNLVSLDRLLHCSAARRRQSFGNCCSPARILCTQLGRWWESMMAELLSVRDRCESCSPNTGSHEEERRVDDVVCEDDEDVDETLVVVWWMTE